MPKKSQTETIYKIQIKNAKGANLLHIIKFLFSAVEKLKLYLKTAVKPSAFYSSTDSSLAISERIRVKCQLAINRERWVESGSGKGVQKDRSSREQLFDGDRK